MAAREHLGEWLQFQFLWENNTQKPIRVTAIVVLYVATQGQRKCNARLAPGGR